jgi:predicted ferric reductase
MAFGVAGYCYFAISLMLATRWTRLENWFGGLDQIYHLHRRCGLWAFVLLICHPLIISIKWIPQHWNKFFFFLLPLHERTSVNLGSLAFWLMLVIIAITLLKLLAYDRWKRVHQWMSVVFVIASFHIILSEKLEMHSLLYVPMAVGMISIIYKQLILTWCTSRPTLKVSEVRHLNDNTVAITCSWNQPPLAFTPGQYGFFSFRAPHITLESHPFTLVGVPLAPTTTLLVKARGDFTRSLVDHLQAGAHATFEGPYGRFFDNPNAPQIWIAGGIGIAPFLSWIQTIQATNSPKGTIDLFYCVHRTQDALFVNELEAFSQQCPRFRYFIHSTEENHRLSAQIVASVSGDLADKTILMCGPPRLTSAFHEQLCALGARTKNIYYEDFEFI